MIWNARVLFIWRTIFWLFTIFMSSRSIGEDSKSHGRPFWVAYHDHCSVREESHREEGHQEIWPHTHDSGINTLWHSTLTQPHTPPGTPNSPSAGSTDHRDTLLISVCSEDGRSFLTCQVSLWVCLVMVGLSCGHWWPNAHRGAAPHRVVPSSRIRYIYFY